MVIIMTILVSVNDIEKPLVSISWLVLIEEAFTLS